MEKAGFSVFSVFDKLLTYFTDINSSLFGKVNTFAEKCLQQGLFDKAKWYYVIIIRWNIDFHQAYWGMVLATLKCKNNDELIQSPIPVDSLPDYVLALKYAKGNESYENMYSNVLALQRRFKRKEALPKKRLIVLVAAGILIAVGAAVLYVLIRRS